MNRSILPRLRWLGLVGIFNGAAALAGQSIDQTIPAEPRGTVEINNRSGTVHVVGWEKSEVQISGDLGSSAERLDVQHEGSTISIRVVMRTGGVHFSSSTDLNVKVPAANSVRISGVSADIEVRGVSGDQKLQSVSGDVQSEAAGADVELKTISGNVKARGKNANVRTTVSTVSGNAEVIDLGGELDLDTVSGDVEIDMGSVSRARLRAISGDVVMTGHLGRDTHVDASSVSGDLRMRWLGAENANVEVESFSGDISACFGNTEVLKPKFGPGSTWRYSPQGAAADIRVKTMSGDVTICNR